MQTYFNGHPMVIFSTGLWQVLGRRLLHGADLPGERILNRHQLATGLAERRRQQRRRLPEQNHQVRILNN